MPSVISRSKINIGVAYTIPVYTILENGNSVCKWTLLGMYILFDLQPDVGYSPPTWPLRWHRRERVMLHIVTIHTYTDCTIDVTALIR